ncbi:hypothetical protein [Pseudogracilibacillus sp. SO30301A]|uniref:hypothetical protein n=1 Tax=Pseudogracilibacillus sp. SO30301A TaxID=3098291 RepID=UPI00300E4424
MKDLGEGIYELHNNPLDVLYHLLLFAGNVRFRPVDTSLYISKALTDSYIKNVVKGDNESKARWFTYVFGTLAVEFIGPGKGTGTAIRTSKNSSRLNSIKNSSPVTGANIFSSTPKNELAFAGAYDPKSYNA